MSEPATRPAEGESREVFWTGLQGWLVGLSTDDKPTARPNGDALTIGTRWRNFDDGRQFEFTGVRWREIAAAGPVEEPTTDVLLRHVLSELRGIRELLAMSAGMPAVFPPLP